VFDQFGLDDASEGFHSDLIFIRQPFVKHVLCKTSRSVPTLLNLLSICIEDSVLEIGKFGGLNNKNLVSADTKVTVGKALDQPGAEIYLIRTVIQHNEIVACTMHFGELEYVRICHRRFVKDRGVFDSGVSIFWTRQPGGF